MLVLSREVPREVVMRTEPVEVVRVHVETKTDLGTIETTLRREQAEVTGP